MIQSKPDVSITAVQAILQRHWDLTDGGNGEFSSWEEFIKTFYGEDQTGTFWENWHDLFRTTCLERDVFNECFGRLLTYCEYNAPHRYFVHNDCHAWNILSDGRSITGIIDAGFLYGDFLIDIATIEDAIPGRDVADAFRTHYEKMGRPIPNFSERLNGARYFKGLDGMRFFAKMGWDHAYKEFRDQLISLPN
ncbi:phosphotransferase [Paenibacillus tarimensis]